MPGRELTVWTLFLAAAVSVVILLAAFLAALVLSQRRRLALERAHTGRLLAAQEEERSRVARELHDDALQQVALIRTELDALAAEAEPALGHRLRGVSGELEELGTVLRTAARSLHPSAVEKAGLVRALGELAAEFGRAHGLEVRLDLPPAGLVVPPAVGVAAYRVAQEALRNVVRHAGVNAADLGLEAGERKVTLRIADRGRGFDQAAPAVEAGLGLVAMRQRVEALGGHFVLGARPGGGTLVTATLPLAEKP